MKKRHVCIICLTALNIGILFLIAQIREKDQKIEKEVEKKISTITFSQESRIPVVEDETARKLREAGLDGGSATVETSLEK